MRYHSGSPNSALEPETVFQMYLKIQTKNLKVSAPQTFGYCGRRNNLHATLLAGVRIYNTPWQCAIGRGESPWCAPLNYPSVCCIA